MTKKAFTLIEVLVGSFLILVVFIGIFGAYQLSLRVIGQSKNTVIAAAIANAEIEKIKVLSYGSIGTVGGYPEGIIESSKTTVSNGIEYTIETQIDYVVDPTDGISEPDDQCPNDYKKIEVRVSWSGLFGGEVNLINDISPDSLAQECAEIGGILFVSVFDAYGVMVPSPLIEIKDTITDEIVTSAVPINGEHFFSLAPASYKVVVSKSNYSTSRTYGIEEAAIPDKPHPLVLEGNLSQISFSIDRLSSFSVQTLSSWSFDYFFDSFEDTSKIAESVNILVSQGEAVLDDYLSPGYVVSEDIAPQNLISWEEFSFSDDEPPSTEIIYRVLYFDGFDWVLIPDSDLPDNSSGFAVSPVDLSGLAAGLYSQLRVKAYFSNINSVVSPALYDWQVSWRDSSTALVPNVSFNLRGDKIIGLDGDENPVYKYNQSHNSGSSGSIDIYNLEWDSYLFSIDPLTGLDLADTSPLQPIGLDPAVNMAVNLFISSQNSLWVAVYDLETGEPVFSANVRLYNTGLGYDGTQYTDQEGKSYFIPLEPATYNIEVAGPGYSNYSDTVYVSGDKTKLINLQALE